MNAKVFFVIVAALGFTLVLCVGGVIALLATGNPVDDILKQAITGIVTGLLGLMARTPTDEASGKKDDPVHVAPDLARDGDHGYSLVEVMVAAFFAVLILFVVVQIFD